MRETWAEDANEVRRRFEEKMTHERGTITNRIRRFLIPRFDERVAAYQIADVSDRRLATIKALNHASEILIDSRSDVMADYRTTVQRGLSQAELIQKVMQAGKSNAGKIFERFSAYALSRSLHGSKWAIWKDTQDIGEVLGVSKEELFTVRRKAFGTTVEVMVEADYIAFMPCDPLKELVFVSCKSSMKDRLHNVTMWAMLLKMLKKEDFCEEIGLEARQPALLRSAKYVLVTGDIAVEQPDLRGDVDGRSLLQFDASFFDAAFVAVTPTWNSRLMHDYCADNPPVPFCRLSAFPSYLQSLDLDA